MSESGTKLLGTRRRLETGIALQAFCLTQPPPNPTSHRPQLRTGHQHICSCVYEGKKLHNECTMLLNAAAIRQGLHQTQHQRSEAQHKPPLRVIFLSIISNTTQAPSLPPYKGCGITADSSIAPHSLEKTSIIPSGQPEAAISSCPHNPENDRMLCPQKDIIKSPSTQTTVPDQAQPGDNRNPLKKKKANLMHLCSVGRSSTRDKQPDNTPKQPPKQNPP